MSDSKDQFYEDENGESVFVPEDKTPEQTANDIQAAVDPVVPEIESEHILIPEGKTLEDVVDRINSAPADTQVFNFGNGEVKDTDVVTVSVDGVEETTDGKRSELLERALEDYQTAVEHGDVTGFDERLAEDTAGAIPAYHPGDLAGYAEGRVGNVEFLDDGSLHLILDAATAADSLKAALRPSSIVALSIFEAPLEDSDDDYVPPDTFKGELRELINRYSIENDSGTPDFILADYLMKQLETYEETLRARANFRGTPLNRFGYETGAEARGTTAHEAVENLFRGGEYNRFAGDTPVSSLDISSGHPEELLTTAEPMEYPNTPYNPDGVSGVDGNSMTNKENS